MMPRDKRIDFGELSDFSKSLVLRNFQNPEIIAFAAVSPQSREAVEKAEIDFSDEKIRVLCGQIEILSDESRSPFVWTFFNNVNGVQGNTIQDLTDNTQVAHEMDDWRTECANVDQAVCTALSFIVDLLKRPIDRFECSTKSIDNYARTMRLISTLELKKMHLNVYDDSGEHLKDILAAFNPTSELRLRGRSERLERSAAPFDRAFVGNSVIIEDLGDWVTPDDILNSNLAKLSVYAPSFTTVLRTVNQFVKNWLAGQYPIFNLLYVECQNVKNYDMEDISFVPPLLDGLEVLPYGAASPMGPPTDNTMAMRTGRDIVRPDGSVGTLACNKKAIIFLVWSEWNVEQLQPGPPPPVELFL
ncbi:unnamed protein product [Caenorhabditis sp. 36 PRJEB53466]|nr:unnamed protein product [Caenorhabditis sp. 36 PRJEB53466]